MRHPAQQPRRDCLPTVSRCEATVAQLIGSKMADQLVHCEAAIWRPEADIQSRLEAVDRSAPPQSAPQSEGARLHHRDEEQLVKHGQVTRFEIIVVVVVVVVAIAVLVAVSLAVSIAVSAAVSVAVVAIAVSVAVKVCRHQTHIDQTHHGRLH